MSPENHIHPWGLFDDDILVFLRKAASDCNLKIRVRFFFWKHHAEVSVELVVGVFSDRAGVENN